MEHLLNFTSEGRDEGNQTFSLLWGGDSSQFSTRVDLEGCIHLQGLLSGVTASVRQIMGKTCQSFGVVKRGHFMKSSPMGLWREILKVGKQHSKERKSVSLQHGPPPDSAKKPGKKKNYCVLLHTSGTQIHCYIRKEEDILPALCTLLGEILFGYLDLSNMNTPINSHFSMLRSTTITGYLGIQHIKM